MVISVLDALKRGELAIVATDTVYGLAALPNSAGYEKIFALKSRPKDQVLPWLVADLSALDIYAREVPEYARNLATMFWPGALTLVVYASDMAREWGPIAKDGTIALRCPDDKQLLEIISKLDAPLACTSANKHGEPAVSRIANLCDEMRSLHGFDQLHEIMGSSNASTIVDCTGEIPKFLRDGPISEQLVYDVGFYGATLA